MTTRQHIVIFDGDCQFCSAQMRMAARLDWLRRFRFLVSVDPEVARIIPGVSSDALDEAIHCVTAQGRIFRGVRCLRFIGLRTPLLFPLALLLWIPGMLWIAEPAYRWVSRNRYILSRFFGCTNTCPVTPPDRDAGGKG